MQLVILCGGLATRLEALCKNIPKSMILVNGKPFLEHQIEYAKQFGVTDIILCVGHLSNYIEKYFGDGHNFGVSIRYSYDGDKFLGPIGALKKASSYLDDVFFSLYGDSFVFVDYKNMYDVFMKKTSLGMMSVFQNFDKIEPSNIVVYEGHVVKYNKDKTNDMSYIDYGVSIFRKKALELITESVFFSTKDFYLKLVNLDELLAYKVIKRFYHIGTPSALDEFRSFVKNRQS